MRRGINITVALILIAIIIKVMAVPNDTVAGAHATAGQDAMSIYNLHAAYPDMKNLPVQEAPQP